MPNRNGRLCAALGGLTLILSGWGECHAEAKGDKPSEATRPAGEPQHRISEIQSASSSDPLIVRLKKGPEADQQVVQDRAQLQDTLDQSRRQADAAWWQVWTQIVGSILIFLTLLANAMMAKTAMDATKIAKEAEAGAGESLSISREAAAAAGRAADGAAQGARWMRASASATSRQAEIAEKTADQQLRAYVHVDQMKLVWSLKTGEAMFVATCKNTGQTPAGFFELAAVAKVTTINESAYELTPSDLAFGGWAALGAHSERTATVPAEGASEITRENFRKTPESILTLRGCLRYVDVFGVYYESEFAYFTYVSESLDEIKMAAIPGRLRVFERAEQQKQLAAFRGT